MCFSIPLGMVRSVEKHSKQNRHYIEMHPEMFYLSDYWMHS